MRSKSPEIMTQIKDYVEEFYFENSLSPSIREIARGVGIGSTTVFRYLQEMSEKGMLLYDGESVTTEKIKKMKTGSVSIPIVGSIACGIPNLAEENIEAYVSLPEAIFGRGCFYILRASGSSMIEVGINDGDLVEMLVYSSMSPCFSRLSAVLQEKSHVFSHCFRGVHIGLNLHQIPLNTRPDYQLHPTPSCRTHQYKYLMWYGCLYVPASL